MKPSPSNNRAFTLIEMLAVIGIIALLVALLFPAIKSALIKGEVARAQSGISNLSTAFKAYYTEYGRWPVSTAGSITVTTPLIGILQGEDINGVQSLIGSPTASVSFNGNPRRIVFLEFKADDLVVPSLNTTNFIDPWKKAYYCMFDVTYVNQLSDPFWPPGPCPGGQYCLNAGYLIWSWGPDGQMDQLGDTPSISAANMDNVKSW